MDGEGWTERDGRRGMEGEGWRERDGGRGMEGEGEGWRVLGRLGESGERRGLGQQHAELDQSSASSERFTEPSCTCAEQRCAPPCARAMGCGYARCVCVYIYIYI